VLWFTRCELMLNSGKIMRRILRKLPEVALDPSTRSNLGDISTLADASVVDALLEIVSSLTEKPAGELKRKTEADSSAGPNKRSSQN